MSHPSFELADQLIKWDEEARAVIDDVKNNVQQICISESLPATDHCIYLNCETLEGNKYTICLSSSGFQIVGKDFNKVDAIDSSVTYETPYAMLTEISESYKQSFGEELKKALIEHSKKVQAEFQPE